MPSPASKGSPVTVREAIDGEVMELARSLDLTTYEAAYLALAARRGLPVATIDERLGAACSTVGIGLVS